MIQVISSQSTPYIIRFLDDPGPIELQLLDSSYNTDLGARPLSWCLQRHVKHGVQHNADDPGEDKTPDDDEDSSD